MAYLLQHLLSESAHRHPDREALRFNGKAMTYAELDAHTNRVARALRAAGVGRGDRVGIYVNKSPASLLAVFGILKAGGVYVPLDPAAPAERLAYIAGNCEIRVLVSSPAKNPGVSGILAAGAPIEHLVEVEEAADEEAGLIDFALDITTWRSVLELPGDPLEPAGTIDTDLAYILYTSGSTGDPKGVMIAHRTIFTFIDWCTDTFEIGPGDRVTSHAPLHFDLSTFDIFVTIKAGATIVLVPERASVFPINLVKLLVNEQVNVTYMVPSIFSLMVNYGKLADFDLSALRLVLFAGEVFPIKYLRRLVEAIPHAEFYNLYGPTETNVCTYYQVRPEDTAQDQTSPVPIGVSCENMEAFALDDDGRRVTAPGQEGELWVRGGCVALGYWGDPEKTAAGFIRTAAHGPFEETVYRTGDIVQLAEDGENWLFVGRRDHMIKSRGYRIELGEIEAALYEFKGLAEAAVIAIPDDLIGNRLKAFVVASGDSELALAEIKAHCAGRLPGYMVPEQFEQLDVLPKTSTGKVDRTGLVKRSG